MSEIRIAQYFKLVTPQWTDIYGRVQAAQTYKYQNYFIGSTSTYLSESYTFAPFQADGSMASLNGDNEQLQVLFPNIDYAVLLVEAGNGNRLSVLDFTTAWLDAAGTIINAHTDYYIGLGASFSETTIELRFRSAVDSVGSAFPGRTLTRQLVGPLPLNSELYLR
jgi:hypothetical protein